MSLVTIAFACGDLGDRFPAPPPYSGTGGGYSPPLPQPCTDGDTRDCHVVLGKQGDILSCYDGTQTCAGGMWGDCVDGTVRVSPAPPDMPHPFALTDAGGCANNPCDPTCQSFGVDAGPDGGSLSIPNNPGGATWQSGSLSTLASAPGGLVNKGLLANCTSAFDCQFDFKCTNPAVSNCTHSKCATGAALAVGCDPPVSTGTPGCVAEICASTKDPACCKTPLALTGCSKSPCQANPGAAPAGCLNATVLAAIASITSGTPSCLTNWTQACADAYRKLPTVGCGWDQQCVNEVASVCGVTCDQDNGTGVCVQRLANEKNPACPGVDLTAGIPCDSGIPICNHGMSDLPSQQIRLWLYPANSGHIPAGSPSGSPSPTECIVTKAIPAGKCVNVTTTECSFNGTNKEIIVNPGNAGLTNPAPINECTRNNNWTLYSGGGTCGGAVCAGNKVATSTTPVNMFFMFDRSGSMNQIPSGQSQTKLTTAKNAVNAFFNDPKAAGTKIWFRTFPDDDSDPASGTKCQDANNCQLTGEINACSIAQITGTLPDSNLVNYVTNMTTASGTPSYVSLSGALKAATAYKSTHPNEAVAVVYVTDGAPSNGGCTTKAAAARDAAAAAYSAGVSTYVMGMAGAEYEYLDPIAAAGVGHFTCDGSNPCPSPGVCTACKKQNQNCGSDAECCDGYGACSTKCQTGTATQTCQGLAINADTSSSATIASKLLSIKAKLTSCTMGISACKGSGAVCSVAADCCSNTCTGGFCVGGAPGFDVTGGSLIYTNGVGDSTVEPYVTSNTGCSGTANDGWYFDNPTAPSTVTLCPKTCSTVQADANPQVNLTLACPPPYSKTVLTLQYEANCPAGTNPQWAYFAYDSTTPADSTIEFYGQYAGTAAGLCPVNTVNDLTTCASSLTKLAVPSAKGGVTACTAANAATTCPSKVCGSNGKCTDPQVCQTSPVYPGCPVDLFAKMNATVGAAAKYYQLVIYLNPSTGGLQSPNVNNIGLTYSCPPSD